MAERVKRPLCSDCDWEVCDVMCRRTIGAFPNLLELLVLVHLPIGLRIRLLIAQLHRHDGSTSSGW